MREFLFRGKNEAGVWHYGAYLPYESGEVAILESFSKYGYEAVELSQRYKVIPETVGQYTGLTDKNGKKIFEGDIVKAECDLYHGENKKERVTHIGTVIYDKKFCQFGINVAGFSKCYVLNRWKGDYNEVIGNIHDSPELLKGGAE